MSSKTDLKLDWCSYEAAKYAVEHWHYSKTMPLPPVVKIGVWERGQFIGALLFSRGASPNLGKPYNLSVTEIAELTRVALKRHVNPVTRIVAIAIHLLKQKEPGLRLLVSFADANEGHLGTIYQAGGWVFVGRTSRKLDYIGPDGKRYRDRQVTSTGRAKQFGKVTTVYKTTQCVAVEMQPKYRYLMPLDAEMRVKILPLAKPYPKRATSDTIDTAAHHAAEGGAAPTVALQN